MKRIDQLDLTKFNNEVLDRIKPQVDVFESKSPPVINEHADVKNMELLERCRAYWDNLSDFRYRRRRARRYYRGDQWSDIIQDPDSVAEKYISEETYIMNQGKVPLKQNQIRQIVKNVLGQYRSNPNQSTIMARARENAEASEMLTNALQYVHQINMADDLDVRELEEFILSGSAIQKVGYKFWRDRNIEDVLVENISPQRMFFNTDLLDVRLFDLRTIGEIIDMTLDEIVSVFAKDKNDEKRIRELYGYVDDNETGRTNALSSDNEDFIDFNMPRDPSKCRLFEIWDRRTEWRTYAHDTADGSYEIVDETMEEIAEQNAQRLLVALQMGIPEESVPLIEASETNDSFWYVKYLTPEGHVLWEGETPYEHNEHPYAITLYPLLDGEVWGFVEDIIDQQRYINRLIILLDFIISASAKGVLMIPEDAVPDDMNPDEFAAEWKKFNGVIFYKSNKRGEIPKQISANSTNVGIHETLALQMKLLQEVSGVHSAMQGVAPKAGTPSSLYAQEAQNASLNNLDLMMTYAGFKQKRDNKIIKTITQYYEDKRFLAIAGRTYTESARLYDPEKVKDIDFELVVTQSQDTPVYRQLTDDMLMKMFEGQVIDVEMFLENTSMPFADKLLDSIRKRKEQMQNGQQGELSPEMMGQVNGGANPEAMAMIEQAAQVQ